MPKFHELCPICNGELKKNILLNNMTWFGKKINIIKYICTQDHFIQISDFYKNILLQSVSFDLINLTINYVYHTSFIYLNNNSKIELKNKIVNLDFPLLEKAKEKVKILTLFS